MVEYARHHCTRRPRLPVAGRLFSRQPSRLREASTITAASPDQGEFSETGSATCQEAFGTDQYEFGEFAYAAV